MAIIGYSELLNDIITRNQDAMLKRSRGGSIEDTALLSLWGMSMIMRPSATLSEEDFKRFVKAAFSRSALPGFRALQLTEEAILEVLS